MSTTSDLQPRQLLDVAGRLAGLATAGAELIRDGANVMYRLPHGIVARIGRVGTAETARREIWASRWLAQSGLQVVTALDDVEQPTVVASQPITWWRLLPPHRPATPAELGLVLRKLHALPMPSDSPFPALDPFADLHERIGVASSVSADDIAWLQQHLAELRAAYEQLPPGLSTRVVHGDAWQGNIAVPDDGQPVLLDLETMSIGRPEWDLISLAVDRTDFERITANEYADFVDTYGGHDVIAWPGFRTLASLRELRWLSFVLNKASTNERAAAESRHRVACLRGEVARPWAWSAF
ncbi:aminoglycoside phosphotransferase family protein [Kutzneria sp. NPDC051319]|uniref:aminoglycoside phosphotransferase family protein n=1 Tax=Kutzneria sp. NPDC051319 TaxID=3155047 RepID=UPI0034273E67